MAHTTHPRDPGVSSVEAGAAAQQGRQEPGNRAILIDIGGVLAPDHLTEAATAWAGRLGIAAQDFIGALFAGNDDHILIGRTAEADWWRIVAGRLGLSEDRATEIRQDLTARRSWNTDLVATLRRAHPRAATAIISNAWPETRTAITNAGLDDLTDAIILSCEVGHAKPDPRIYTIALDRINADPRRTLFIDDTPSHVKAAESLGMTGHHHTATADTINRIETFLQAPA